jgi:hypothetical protein
MKRRINNMNLGNKNIIDKQMIPALEEFFDEVERIRLEELFEDPDTERADYLDDAAECIEMAIMRLEEAVRR